MLISLIFIRQNAHDDYNFDEFLSKFLNLVGIWNNVSDQTTSSKTADEISRNIATFPVLIESSAMNDITVACHI